jgi:thymidine phosphorylase
MLICCQPLAPASPMTPVDPSRPPLRIRRVNLDTGRENVVVISRRSKALRPEIFRGFSRVELRRNAKELLATLLITEDDGLVGPGEIGLSEPAFHRFAEPVGSLVTVTPAAPPESLEAVRAKIRGRTLIAPEITAIIDDLAHYRYSDMEIAAFLIGSASFMTSDELLALTHAMAKVGTQLKWSNPIVVDKHCIGGIPGNRTSMIVVPIVAAHGLPIPKTSSRAITSPAGTADTMEVLARVNVGADEMKAIVAACNGCLIWGGHVNLSPADDILISVERPLSLDTREQMVASIMSKKLAAGSTHLLIDLPVGPTAKLTNGTEAMRLRKLFEFVGDHFGISVEVITTDGSQPIGNGIGPVLEARDVMAVLANDPAAPADLREKSLRLAAHLLEYDPKLRGGAGYARARELLDSGAARRQMQKIIEAQGRSDCRTELGNLTFDVMAGSDGRVSGIDCLQLNRLARTAGAPIDKGAGIRLFKKIGDRVEHGEPLYRVYAFDQSEHDLAAASAGLDSGYSIEAQTSFADKNTP